MGVFFLSIDEFIRGRNHMKREVQPIINFRTLFLTFIRNFLGEREQVHEDRIVTMRIVVNENFKFRRAP